MIEKIMFKLFDLMHAPPAIFNRGKIKKILLMVGVTPEEQQRIYELGLHMHDDNITAGRRLTDGLQRRGAKFVYVVDGNKLKRNPALTDEEWQIAQGKSVEPYRDYEDIERERQQADYEAKKRGDWR